MPRAFALEPNLWSRSRVHLASAYYANDTIRTVPARFALRTRAMCALYDLKREQAGSEATFFTIDDVMAKTGRSREVEMRSLGLLTSEGFAVEHDGRYSITQMGEDVVSAGEQPLYPVI